MRTTIQHGTVAAYKHKTRPCRCTKCRAAVAAYQRDYTSRRCPPPPGDDRHGTTACYTNYGCRCHLCKMAVSLAGARRRERLKYATQP